MAQWKVLLEGEEQLLTKLSQAYTNKEALVIRDGVNFFLESTEFEYFSEHTEVKEKAASMIGNMLQQGGVAPNGVALGPVYRIHYDNSKTVYR